MGYRKHQLHIEVFDHHAAAIARELYVCRACGAELWVEAPARDRPTTFAWLQAEHDAEVARPRWSSALVRDPTLELADLVDRALAEFMIRVHDTVAG